MSSSKPKNILFLMTDQQRYDHVGYYPENKIETPNMDRIAEGTAFLNCQTVNPICQPARTALITGKYSHQIGTLAMSGDFSFKHPTFMQALQGAGYYTAGVGKFHFLQTWKWGTEKGKGVDLVALKKDMQGLGFDYVWETSGKQLAVRNHCDYCEHLREHGLLDAFRDFTENAGKNQGQPSEELEHDGKAFPLPEEHYIDVLTGDQVVSQIVNRPKDKPFYIFGSFCSPHKPFDPPQRYLDQVEYEEFDDFIPGDGETLTEEQKKTFYKLRRAYKATIKLVDDQIGRILDTLESEGILDDTVVLFTSDHGEMMGDHYRVQKGVPWKESLTVPTAIRHPDFLNKQMNTSPVEITDLTATILDVAGLNVGESLGRGWPAFNGVVPCRSLLPLVSGESDAVRDYSFSECGGIWQCVQNEHFKYIRYLKSDSPEELKEEFYDLREDACESVNLIERAEYQSEIAACRRYRDWVLDNTPPAQMLWAERFLME